MTLVLILVFAALWIPDLPGMLRRKQWAELCAFTVLWTLALVISLFIHYNGDFDHVNKLLRAVFEPIGQLVIQRPPD